jgi:hypothetical protein
MECPPAEAASFPSRTIVSLPQVIDAKSPSIQSRDQPEPSAIVVRAAAIITCFNEELSEDWKREGGLTIKCDLLLHLNEEQVYYEIIIPAITGRLPGSPGLPPRKQLRGIQ